MNGYATLAAAYLTICFMGAALHVRLAPRFWSSRALRRHLVLTPFLPILLFLDLIQLFAWIPRVLMRGLRILFETLSGHRTYVKRRYGYYEYGRYK